MPIEDEPPPTVRDVWVAAGKPRVSWGGSHSHGIPDEWWNANPPAGRCQVIVQDCWRHVYRREKGIWCGARLPCHIHEWEPVSRRRPLEDIEAEIAEIRACMNAERARHKAELDEAFAPLRKRLSSLMQQRAHRKPR